METEKQSEFDKVFSGMEAPDYPAICNACGAEGTNASLESHECTTETTRGRARKRQHERCPFCGSTNLDMCNEMDSSEWYYYVLCGHCEACGPTDYDEQKAWDLWDSRVSLDNACHAGLLGG